MIFRRSPFVISLIITGMLLMPVITSSVFAQEQDETDGGYTAPQFRSLTPGSGGQGILSAQQQLQTLPSRREPVAQEGTVDPNRYQIGPGDMFSISISGPQTIQITEAITADGHLSLPGAGTVSGANLTLAEFKEKALRKLKDHYSNVEVTIALARPRKFQVHVAGAVPNPGRHTVPPMARVSDAVKLAYASSESIESPVSLQSGHHASLRNIRVRHQGGTVDTVDLLRYRATGDVKYNPYLRDGDVVFVSSYDTKKSVVFVDGSVAYPGVYPLRKDDRLTDIISLATEAQSATTHQEVRLTRYARSDSSTIRTIHVDSLRSGAVGPIGIRAQDHIHISDAREPTAAAAITGYVMYPGTYPIRHGQTRASKLIELAGGYRPGAFPERAYLVRNSRLDTVANSRLSNLDFFSRAYLTQVLTMSGRTPVDLTALSERNPLYLENGDRLIVPPERPAVTVIGHVLRPGPVTYRDNYEVGDYLQEAGGTGASSGETYVIKAGTKEWVHASNATIRSGDIIFVNRDDASDLSPNLKQLALRKTDMQLRTAQAIFSAIGAATSIITAYIAISR